MLLSSVLALALAAAPVGCTGAPLAPFPPSVRPTGTVPQDSLAALYAAGVTWAEFLEGVRARRAAWIENYESAELDSGLVERINRLPGRWRFLVIAEDWCGDSANTIPYLARLVEGTSNLELRVVKSDPGRWVMESHHTEDGRAATPTVVLLDEAGTERGCWIERPYALRTVVADLRASGKADNLVEVITAWRREDRGRSTLTDLTELLEAAAAGTVRCP